MVSWGVRAAFVALTWLPVIAFAAAVVLGGIGLFLKIRKRPCRKIFVWAAVMLAIPIVYIFSLIIIGFIGFGPGLSDMI